MATKYGPSCPQISSDGRKIIGSEDCLFLNVFTPLVILSITYTIIYFTLFLGICYRINPMKLIYPC